MRVLMLTSEWPTQARPTAVPFLVRQVDFLQKAGVDVEVFHFRGARKPYNYIWAWYQVQKRLASGSYDLVHAQWGQSAFPAFPRHVPLIVTFRGSDLNGIVGTDDRYLWSGYFLSWFSRLVARLADEVIVVSESMVEKIPRREYHIVPSGLDFELFKPMERSVARKKMGWPMNYSVIFFGGDQSVPGKRYHLANDAVRLLQLDYPEVMMVPAQKINYSLMPVYLNASDVLLFTSLSEGSPNIVKEALACNLPVVSTDVGDVRERIGNIEGCEVCKDDRPETIAAALLRVLSRGQRINGRQAVLNLDEKLLTKKVIKVYQQAIEGKA